MACLFETPESLGVFIDRAVIFLEDNLLPGCGTDDFGELSPRGGIPGGPARIADIVSEQEGFEPEFCRLAITEGTFACPREIASGFIPTVGA